MKQAGSTNSNSNKNNYMRVLSGLKKSDFRMKTVTESAGSETQDGYKFKINTDQDPSLQSWEEENLEYVSWNLILDQNENPSC